MKSPWSWVLTLFSVEEIPAAMVTFVAPLMFMQLGADATSTTLYSALLFIPWVLKSFLRSWVRRMGHFRQMLFTIQGFLFLALVVLAFSFPYKIGNVFAALLTVSLLCAWHELAGRMYYERMLFPEQQRKFTTPKVISSQLAVILTYGVLIIIVGNLQVYFRHIRHSWSMGCYTLAGVFLLFTLYHLLVLKNPHINNHAQANSMAGSVLAEVHVIERIRKQPRWWVSVLTMFLLLVPQSLMFFSRVLFLFDKQENGGLECTIQEIGYAQGTIGVIAFSIGLAIGRELMKWIPAHRIFWPLSILLGLSPLVYLMMTIEEPDSLPILCIATFQAQLFFGMGLCICRIPLQTISGERYRNNVNLMAVPLVAACMILPMALSGLMVQSMGYHTFFLIDVLSAPFGWIVVLLLRHFFPAPKSIQTVRK